MSVTECRIEADLLIIGGGSAGAMAAIWAKTLSPDLRVVVFDKSDVMYSGSIPRGMDALNVVAVPGLSTPEEYLTGLHIAAEEIVDDSPSYAMISRTWALVQTLESWGVYFPKDDQGRNVVLDAPPKGKFCLALQDPDLKPKLARKMRTLGVRVLNRTMAVELLLGNDASFKRRVVGAIGLNIRNQGLVVCQARAIILACGGTARFGATTNGYAYGTFDFPGNTGEGYAMAFRAGAELTGFEYTMVDYSVKDVNVAGLHISLTRGARVLDAFDTPVDASDLSIERMLAQHLNGKGPLRLKMQHLPENKVREIEDILFTTERPVQQRFFQGRGIDFRQSDIEHWPSECFLCGGHGFTGLRVNSRAQTSVPGLYAAGDVVSLRGFLPGAFVMAQLAVESALDEMHGAAPASSSMESQIDAVREHLGQIETRRGPVSIQEFEAKVRRTVGDYIAPPKNGYKLARALEWMARFRHECGQLTGVRDTADIYKTLEVESIITSGILSATASAARCESRWGVFHWRNDYPERDDANWLKHVILQRGTQDQDVCVSFRPVERMVVQ